MGNVLCSLLVSHPLDTICVVVPELLEDCASIQRYQWWLSLSWNTITHKFRMLRLCYAVIKLSKWSMTCGWYVIEWISDQLLTTQWLSQSCDSLTKGFNSWISNTWWNLYWHLSKWWLGNLHFIAYVSVING